jgi:2'-5' RNA ligase
MLKTVRFKNHNKMNQKRIQLTLFINENELGQIEKIRKKFNPEQYELINAHVTLCREDELAQIEAVILNLTTLELPYVTIDFGKINRFSDRKGVLIPAIGENEQFKILRKAILNGIINEPRNHEPHITLMHPRNSTCSDSIFNKMEKMEFPVKIEFRKISLIEQEVGKKWVILREFELKNMAL